MKNRLPTRLPTSRQIPTCLNPLPLTSEAASVSICTSSPLREEVVPNHLRMIMNRGINAHALNTTNHLGNLALIDGPQARAGRVNDLARRGGEFLHKRKVLHQKVSRPASKPCTSSSRAAALTLYMSNGLMPNASTTSLLLNDLFLHFCISTGLKSCGEYTSPASHLLGICFR